MLLDGGGGIPRGHLQHPLAIRPVEKDRGRPNDDNENNRKGDERAWHWARQILDLESGWPRQPVLFSLADVLKAGGTGAAPA